ncbi:uncharacterized protein LOC111400130 [Olea europaea var. sylvestris]|uniref:uncharacterized protein LOC111400130 n=1 Tax=Olea europaea var. sylvestris TaxID=158386 RepID=UPI000C1D64DC|nr:uncharacterized protein LOC111400130 [Olea europaea var. sylvestris]
MWSSERAISKKTPGVYEVDAYSAISAKIDSLHQKFGNSDGAASHRIDWQNARLDVIGETSSPAEEETVVKESSSKENLEKSQDKAKVTDNPYEPTIPFPQRLKKQKMPSYAKYLKDIISNKRKLEDHEAVMLTEECSAKIHNKLPPKLKDPGSFTVPCKIGEIYFDKILCDLGASINLMLLSVFRKLGLGEAKATTVTLRWLTGH